MSRLQACKPSEHIDGVPDIGEVDCSYRVIHRSHLTHHPLTGRLICERCHPVPKQAWDRALLLAQQSAA